MGVLGAYGGFHCGVGFGRLFVAAGRNTWLGWLWVSAALGGWLLGSLCGSGGGAPRPGGRGGVVGGLGGGGRVVVRVVLFLCLLWLGGIFIWGRGRFSS